MFLRKSLEERKGKGRTEGRSLERVSGPNEGGHQKNEFTRGGMDLSRRGLGTRPKEGVEEVRNDSQ